MLLKDLIQQVPREVESEVRKAKDRFNARIRHGMRGETRLNLRRRADAARGRDETVAVPIVLVSGLPKPLEPQEKQAIDNKFGLAVILGRYRRELTALRDCGEIVSEQLIPQISSESAGRELLDGREESIKKAQDYAAFLLKRLDEFDLTKFILRVNEDVLGRYTYRVRPYSDHPNPTIELYWGVIGLVAHDLRISVEDLTYVVLAHELAHAYTHVGFDANDCYWDSDHFAKTAHELKEGLAQFYTLQICKLVAENASDPVGAFSALLSKQPDAYSTHIRWQNASPEDVRLAMLETRSSGKPGTLAQFEASLREACSRLRH